jgi:hypothetical protein
MPNNPCNSPQCQEAADLAVKRVFAILGVDIDHPESVEEFREDLRFGRKMRKVVDHGFFAFVGFFVVATATILFTKLGFRIGG